MNEKVSIRYIGGNCPVQAEGLVDGQPFYFRARGEHWSMSIGGSDVIGNPDWFYKEEYPGGEFMAGWMGESEALSFIDQSASAYLAEKKGETDTSLE